jgi:hypothetical protein
MAITVKHTKVSTIPDGDDSSLIRPSDWNADHQLVGTIPVDNGGTGASTLTGYVYGNGTSAMTAATTIPNTAITGLGTASTKDAGVSNGVATLDGSGTVPISQLPAAVLGALSYQGTWNASTNTPTLTSSVGTKGYYYVVNVAGSTNLNGITDWVVGDWAVYNGTAWQKVDNTDAVTSVNGYTGTVVLTAADVSAVPYTGATGAVDLNNKSLANVSNLAVGTSTVPTIKIRAVGDNNSSSRIAMRGYSSDANSSAIRVTKFRGTAGAPQAPQSGDSLGKFELAGYGTTSSEGYPQASLEGLATEAWGATARGTKAVIKVTPNTTTTQVTAVTINQDSTAVFANTVTANGVLLTGNTGTVTSVAATSGTGISISGSPITTSGTLTVTNTAPDQTVVLTAGTGISTSGTYPNFTITNTSPSSGGTVTSITAGTGLSGGTITSSGTIAIDSTVATLTGAQTLTNKTISGASNTLTNIGNTSLTNSAITINGTSTSLGGSISVGTVTSVTATSPVVSSGGTTPAISMPAANTTTNGYLTSTDWNTFNSKGSGTVTSVTGTAPVVSSGGATPAISMAAATGSVNGYLTSTDWTTFNNKASPFTYTTNYIPYGQGTTTPNQSSSFTFDGTALTAPRYIGTVSVSGSGTQGAFAYGTMSYSDTNRLATFQTTVNTYSQVEIQNTNAGASASSDMIVGNNNTTATTYYGDFGMNSGGWSGTGAFNSPNNVYLTATTGDLAIGTTTANAIRFAVNGSTTDALTISSTGNVNTPNGIYENSNTINANYTIGTNNNAMSAGPITVATGVTVTVPTGSTWVIV